MTAGGRVCVSTHREVSDATVILVMKKMNNTSALVSQDFCMFLVMLNTPIWLTQCCTQFRSLGFKVLCVFHLHDNIALPFK